MKLFARFAFGFAAPLLLSACPAPIQPTDVPTAVDAGDALDAIENDVPVDTGVDVPPLRPPPITRMPSDTPLETRRQSCMFEAGAWPAETLGSDSYPVGDAIPIDHILVLMQENRSFDHYFSRLPAFGQPDVTVAPADYSNPRADGSRVMRAHDTTYCQEDPDHGWNGSHVEWNNGMNDGFVRANDPGGERAMLFEDENDLPFYYDLASTFAMADHYHCSLLGPTMPNRLYFMAATSFGQIRNFPVDNDTAATPANNIFRAMDRAGLDWKNYAGGARGISFFPNYALFTRSTLPHLKRIPDLMEALRTGALPPFALIEPDYTGNAGDRVDEHPPGMPQTGQRFVESIVRAVMASPAWSRTVLFVVYDENGGYADHVPPPAACAPDALPPVRRDGDAEGGFDRLGFRVPFIVVSPYARAHFVSHRNYDHTSITRFIETRFGLPAMTRRDANATPMMDMFDFTNPRFMTPPTLRPGVVSAAAQEHCRMEFPGEGGAF